MKDCFYDFSAFQNTFGPKDAASVSMAVNSSSVSQYLDTVCQRSKVMLDAGAYLHWYERYGTSKVSSRLLPSSWASLGFRMCYMSNQM